MIYFLFYHYQMFGTWSIWFWWGLRARQHSKCHIVPKTKTEGVNYKKGEYVSYESRVVLKVNCYCECELLVQFSRNLRPVGSALPWRRTNDRYMYNKLGLQWLCCNPRKDREKQWKRCNRIVTMAYRPWITVYCVWFTVYLNLWSCVLSCRKCCYVIDEQ